MSDAITNNDAKNEINKLDGIEILVDWAKSGNIDPWNIDIIEITDMFLSKLFEIKEHNLRLTGRTLFFAAVLLKIKSDILEGLDPFKGEQPDEHMEENFDDNYDADDIADNIKYTNVLSLENALSRRTSVRKNRSRKVTLEDLIKQLRKLEEIENKNKAKTLEEQIKKRRSYTHFTPDDILEMAHDEYIDDEITKLQDILNKLFETEERIELKELTNAGMNKVNAYIALLFLASRSRIDLVQDEFYSDLYIVKEVS